MFTQYIVTLLILKKRSSSTYRNAVKEFTKDQASDCNPYASRKLNLIKFFSFFQAYECASKTSAVGFQFQTSITNLFLV